MLIGIDGNEANQENLVGIGQVAFNVIKTLERLDKTNQYIIYLKDRPRGDFPPARPGWEYRVFGPRKLWTQFALPIKLFIQKERLDVFFSPSHYSPRFSPFPTVVYLMDLWHHRHPEQFDKKDLYQLTSWGGYSVKNSVHILTISNFSKSEIVKFYQYPKEKITVAHPGFDQYQLVDSASKIKKISQKLGIKGKYLVYLGTLQPKKNLVRLVEAFGQVAKKRPEVSLVIAGKKGWLFKEIFTRVEELGLKEWVIFPGFVAEEDKPYLLAGAEAFVFPSLYEGFGIPVLESMCLEVPVVAAKAGSLPEIGGEAAIYCDPYRVESITGAIEKVLNLNKRQRDEIIALGKEQVKHFSWEICARKVLSVLEKVGEKN
jgi:glycosyltransferase involved in cell wall biosynthesis